MCGTPNLDDTDRDCGTTDHCIDCGVNVFHVAEYAYVVKDEIWFEAGLDPQTEHACQIALMLFEAELITMDEAERHLASGGKLCIGCLETRLGRTLTRNDFDMSVRISISGQYQGSDRLQDRMKDCDHG